MSIEGPYPASANPPAPEPQQQPPLESRSRTVARVLDPAEQAEGRNARVRRSLGGEAIPHFSPFLVCDYFTVTKGAGFPDHPHRGQATITYMLEGSFQHEDSKGHRGTISSGSLQWMVAGRGILHAEMPIVGKGVPNPRGLQIWTDLPRQHKMCKPTYHEIKSETIPVAYPSGEEGGVKVKVICGQAGGVDVPVKPVGGCWYLDIHIDAGASYFQSIPPSYNTFLFTLSGSLLVASSPKPYEPLCTLLLSAQATETGIQISAPPNSAVRVLLLAGEPLKQEVVVEGPFVLNTKEGVRKAFEDFRNARNGFEGSGQWVSQIGGGARSGADARGDDDDGRRGGKTGKGKKGRR